MDEHYYMYFDDVDWCHRFRQAGWEIEVVGAARVVHFGPSTAPKVGYLPLRQLRQHYTSLDYFARKHYGQRRTAVIRFLCILTAAKPPISFWLRARLPKAIPGAIVLDHENHHRTLVFYRSLLRFLLWLYRSKSNKP